MDEYLYVLDFNSAKIFEIKLDNEEQELEAEEILSRRGLNADECHFMFTTSKLELETINVKDDESV